MDFKHNNPSIIHSDSISGYDYFWEQELIKSCRGNSKEIDLFLGLRKTGVGKFEGIFYIRIDMVNRVELFMSMF